MAGLVYTCQCPACAGKAVLDDSLHAGTSLAPAPLHTSYTYQYTGDYRIDTLLLGAELNGIPMVGVDALQYRWNQSSPLGTAVTVSYSFMSAKPIYGGTDDGLGDFGFSPFTAAQKAAVRLIMDGLQRDLGIQLVEKTNDTTFDYGQIRFGNNIQEFSAGYSWLPYSTNDGKGGDVWINQAIVAGASAIAPGSFAWATLVHEIGHALGLKHPGDYNAGSTPTTAPGNYLGEAEDNTSYTIMSYRPSPYGSQDRDWYGMYDLLALKALYGSGTANAGDNTYTKQNSDGRILEIIDDPGGFDTLDLSALTRSASIDLRPGGFSSVGFTANGSFAVNNLSISLSTVIENFIGTSFGDTVSGNDAANRFLLAGGSNTADGGGGIDVALYASARSSYQLTISGSGVAVNGPGLNDSLANVERLGFSDRNVAVDLGGAAGITAKILGAVFGAPALKENPAYVGIGLSLLDSGMSYEALMQFALNFRAGGASHAALVELLYLNVVGARPGAEQLALYTGWLDSGSYTAAQLGVFAADNPLNLAHIDWVGLNAHGIDYI